MKWMFFVIVVFIFTGKGFGQVVEERNVFPFSLASINTARQRHQAWLEHRRYPQKVARLLDSAQAQLNKPYAYGAKGPDRYDCSGFTGYVFRKFDIHLPASSRLQAQSGIPVAKEDLQPGDLVFFKTRKKDRIGHVGIVVECTDGRVKFIHSSTSRGVTIDDLTDSIYYATRYVTGRRLLGEQVTRFGR